MNKTCHSAGGKASAFRNPHSAFPRAFTLIELIVTIVVIGIVLLALMTGFQESLKLMARQTDLRKAVVLSEDLMDEIRSKAFVAATNPKFGPETNETARRQFDDVDDYHGLTDAPPSTATGSVMSNFAGFTRRVVVVNVATNDFNGPAVLTNSTSFKRITVVVNNAQFAVSNMSVVSRYD